MGEEVAYDLCICEYLNGNVRDVCETVDAEKS